MSKPLLVLFLFCCAFFSVLSLSAQVVNLSTINSPYSQNFNSLATTGTTNDVSTLPTGWLFIESGTNQNTTYAAGTGSSNAGNTYSFGLDADRSLGGLQSGSLIPLIGAQFINNTGSTITSLQINYTGEQWRLGATGRGADRLDFQYSTSAASLNSGTWIDVDQLDFSSPITTGTVGALNGNAVANRTSISFTITGIAIQPGTIFWMRWQDFNVTSSDDGLGIDDFSVTPVGIPPNFPTITLVPSSLNFGSLNLGQSDTLSFKVIGKNLNSAIAVVSSNTAFEILQNNVYSSTATLPASGGKLTVRFTPSSNGSVSASISLASDTTHAHLSVTGSGYDPLANIISIASARAKSLGTKVTVAGRVTSANQLGSPSYVQDATGGIPVFNFTFSNSITIGDSVIVTGPIGTFNSQIQISGAGIFFSKVNAPSFTPAPKVIQLNQLAAYEGFLVTVQQVELLNKHFVFYPQSTETMVASGTQGDLRIDGDTDIPGLTKPQGVVDITGVVGRFQTNAQLMPRFHTDIPGAAVPSTPSDSIPKSQTFDLVNWNLEFFGATLEQYGTEYGPADEGLQMQNVRKVLDSLKGDVIAIQEVSSDSLFQKMVSLMPGYKSICSDRYSHSFDGPDPTFPPQKVCFIYDSTTVNVLSVRPLFEALYDSARNINPTLLPGYPGGSASSFFSSGRLPFMMTAQVTINGVTEKVNFIDVHAKSGSTSDDRARRLYDGQVLKDSLNAHFPNENFVVLGDLNDDLDQSIVTGLSSPYKNFVDDTTHFSPITLALSESGAKSTVSFDDVIDHQILSKKFADNYISGSVTVVTPFRMIPNYGTTTSDHLPVTSRFRFTAPVANISPDTLTLAESDTTVNVTIQFSKPLTTSKVIEIAVNNGASTIYGSDYTTSPSASGNTLTIQAPEGATSVSFQVSVMDDQLDELNETVSFSIVSQPGITVENGTFALTIDDNDVPSIAFATANASVNEGAATIDVSLTLSQSPVTDQSVTLTMTRLPNTIYGSDFITTPDGSADQITIQVPAGNSEASFSFKALKDDVKEKAQEGARFTISSSTNGLLIGAQNNFDVTIIDVKSKKNPQFVVSPNPTSGIVNLVDVDFDSDYDGTIQVTLRRANGFVIYSGSGSTTEMNAALGTALSHEHNGVYLLTVIAGDEVSTIRLIKL